MCYLPILGTVHFLMIPKIFQKSSDFSIPPSYIIGPGDEIILMLWGDTEDVSDYVVSRDGYILFQILGVFVNGLNLEVGLEKRKDTKDILVYLTTIQISLTFLMLVWVL